MGMGLLRRSLGLAPPTAQRALSTSAAPAAAAAEGEAVAAAKEAKRRKKKNLFDVVQFLPDWGVGYKVAKTTWRDISYQITKINLYKAGRHGKAWGIRYKAGSHNDINVLHRSPLFSKLTEGQAPEVNYTINGHDYKMGYYLVDGIYPAWASFVKTIPAPHGNKKKYFARVQEAVRNDVECAFGVLQARYHIVRGPCRLWNQEDMYYIMNACVIMHNMTIEDERGMENIDYNYDEIGEPVQPSHGSATPLWEFIDNHVAIRDKDVHHRLQADLVEHLWELHSNN